MPNRVYCNIVKHRILDNRREVEDVTKFGLPTIQHPTTTVKSSGMAMDVDMPDTAHLNAMDFTIYHNNGVNCQYLSDPGKHNIEARTARQRYDVTRGEIMHESVKFRIVCVHVESQKGDIETGNPYGSTEKYSVLRYEEEVDGKVTVIADAMAGLIKFSGVDVTSDVDNLLK